MVKNQSWWLLADLGPTPRCHSGICRWPLPYFDWSRDSRARWCLGVERVLVEQRRRARTHSWEAFLGNLEFIPGRYALIEGCGKRVTVQSDATGARAVFSPPDGEVVASHATIVAKSIGAKRSVSPANWRSLHGGHPGAIAKELVATLRLVEVWRVGVAALEH